MRSVGIAVGLVSTILAGDARSQSRRSIGESASRVPASAPDSEPSWLYDDTNVVHASGWPDAFVTDLAVVLFAPGATQVQRQAAVDTVKGSVVGGLRLNGIDGFYLVALPHAPTQETLRRAISTLKTMPGVVTASPDWILAGAMQHGGPGNRATVDAARSESDTLRRLRYTADGGIHYPLRAVLYDSAAFTTLWEQARNSRYDTASVPRVAFGRYMVVVVAMGEGWGVDAQIVSVDSATGTVRVHIRMTGPGDDCTLGAEDSSPIDIVVVPKSYRPIVFVEEYRRYSCRH
jgi:hypothetical protein